MGKKQDARRVSLQFINTFLDGGILKNLIDFVYDDTNKLNLCFRGNSGDVATIYKRNHIFWEIKRNKTKGEVTLSFDFNHARYCWNWKDYLKKLIDLGWKKEKIILEIDKEVNALEISVEEITLKTMKDVPFDDMCLSESYRLIDEIMEVYFEKYKENKPIDYFKIDINSNILGNFKCRKGSPKFHLEKIRQQEIFESFPKPLNQNGYLVYDLEFSDPDNKKGNKPDFLALKYVNGVPYGLVLGEVKSQKTAFDGNSGLEKHLKEMVTQMKRYNAGGNRVKDSVDVLQDYAKLSLRGLGENDRELFAAQNVKNLKFCEIMIVLTDGAIDEYINNPTYSQFVNKIDNVVVKKFVDGKFEDI